MENSALLNELCFIAYKRNILNDKRSKARWKKGYYQKILYALKKSKVDSTVKVPKKWKDVPLLKLRSLILKHQGEYVKLKHQTMELTLSTTKKVRQITKKLDCFIDYNNGYVAKIGFYHTGKTEFAGRGFDRSQIDEIGRKYEGDLYLEGVLGG